MNAPEQHQSIDKIQDTKEVYRIPAKFAGIPSDVVAVLWSEPSQIDVDHKQASKYRENLLLELKKKEEIREKIKENNLKTRYNKLSTDQKMAYAATQYEANQILIEYLKEQREIKDLAMEEFFVLSKAKTMYKKFIEENSNQPFAYKFNQNIDHKIFQNLQQKLTFKIMEKKQHLINQEKANEIRANLGIPIQDLKTEG
jgi:hypothetical protein